MRFCVEHNRDVIDVGECVRNNHTVKWDMENSTLEKTHYGYIHKPCGRQFSRFGIMKHLKACVPGDKDA